MACYWFNTNETEIHIPTAEEVEAVIFYKIVVKVGDVTWSVFHRYSDFYELHNHLVVDHGVSKDILPPKKVIRNKCPLFIESRRIGLELYLRSVLNYLKRTMPRVFLEFLNFHVYDIFFMLQNLALHFYLKADVLLSSSNSYSFSPLQLYAISECFKKPFPEIEQGDKRYDLSHVLDFCSQLKHLTIKGISTTFQSSNIVPNNLKFELSSFKSLLSLEVVDLSLDNVYSVANLRSSIRSLNVHRTFMTSISQILQCDVVHKSVVENDQVWVTITEMDLSSNNLTEIDSAIKLVPNIKTLIVNQNKISSISDLSFLTHLVRLSFSNNLISSCDKLYMKLGNILHLDLSQNSITSLQGFSKLYSLETLDVSCNQLSDIEEIYHIGDLPCLENLILTGNSVATIVDYRIKVLENFGERATEICLDNEKPSQQELDKVSILRALRIVKEGKMPTFNNNANHSFT